MMPSPRPRGTRQAQAGYDYAVGTVARANPLITVFRWRYELAGAAALALAWTALGEVTGAEVVAAISVAVIAMAVISPQARRFLAARAWCIVTPHRVRVGCAQAWIHSRNGKIPIVLLTRRRPTGERVYLWCRAGTSAEDLSSARGLLAAACWAHDVRVSRHPRYAHLITLDVIRSLPRVRPVPAASPPGRAMGLVVLPPTSPVDDGAPQQISA